MSAFGSAIPSVLFGHNASVKAWCLTGRNYAAAGTQAAFDAVNFIDGYNLYLDLETQTSGGVNVPVTTTDLVESGALKFSFITPMSNNKYKVFLQFYRDSSADQRPTYAHVLNSSKFPKTTTSFWVRTGVVRTGAGGAQAAENNRILGLRMNIGVGLAAANIGVVVL
jgi:hypothetical protein